MKAFLIGALSIAVAISATILLMVYTGRVPLAAVSAEPSLLARLIHTAYEKGVQRQARGISPPPGWDAADAVLRGARGFEAMCVGCHTVPGRKASVQAQGLNPRPPELARLLAERSPAEAFWVIQNGVRMTAMPAFGPTHEADELWELVAFAQAAASLSAGDYQDLVRVAMALPKAAGRHSHPPVMMPPAEREKMPLVAASGHAHASAPEVSDQLQAALSARDAAAVSGLLDPQVLIFESGGLEQSRAEYAAHHMPHDMAFMAEIEASRLSRRVFEFGDHAVVATRSHLQGTVKGKPVDLFSTETLLLQRADEHWRVSHIHWSSGPAK